MSLDDREPVHRRHLVRGASARELYDVIVDFDAYPRLFPEIKATRVIKREPPVVRVEFRAQVVVAVRYVLDLVCDPAAASVAWTFVEGEVVTNSTGAWHLDPDPTGTWLDYRASLEVRAPLPGFMLRKVTDMLLAASLPNMFTSIEREAASRRVAAVPAPRPTPL